MNSTKSIINLTKSAIQRIKFVQMKKNDPSVIIIR